MKANAVPLLALFENKMRLEVPLFQRQYVWNREQQWEPLWEDISRKFVEYLLGRKDGPVHFLGGMVLDQKQSPVTYVQKRQVIDGQQRLTTLQIFLSALRDFCREEGCEDLAKEFEGYTLNKGLMADPSVDKFKVWPTQLDCALFSDVICLGSRAAVEERYPSVRRKGARKADPRPRIIEAYLFFSDEIREFFLGTEQEPAIAADQAIAGRIEECFQALKSAIQVVAIDLELGDDAQVIFETLNARGEPLLPADLLKNYIFLRAARLSEPQEELYRKYWLGFDDAWWREEVTQGRLTRPRSDLFMQHFLASRKMVDIPIKHLFVEYRHWIEKVQPFTSVSMELATIAKQGSDFRRLLSPTRGDEVYGLATFLESFDISTVYPLLLFLMDSGLSKQEWRDISTTLESYLLRRAFLGWTTKAYNRVFPTLLKTLRESGPSAERLKALLSQLTGESAAWPTNAQFSEAWQNRSAYDQLNNAKIVHVLKRISDEYLTDRHEQITINSALTVEHILPQRWIEHWPLIGGQRGLTTDELETADEDNPRAVATNRRDLVKQTIGNLTIVSQQLNASVSNSSWATKKPALLTVSLLPINQQLHDCEAWDEHAINQRARKLFEKAVSIWPAPATVETGHGEVVGSECEGEGSGGTAAPTAAVSSDTPPRKQDQEAFFASLPAELRQFAQDLRSLQERHPTFTWSPASASMVFRNKGFNLLELYRSGDVRFRTGYFAKGLGDEGGRRYKERLQSIFPLAVESYSYEVLTPEKANQLLVLIEEVLATAPAESAPLP